MFNIAISWHLCAVTERLQRIAISGYMKNSYDQFKVSPKFSRCAVFVEDTKHSKSFMGNVHFYLYGILYAVEHT